MKFRYYYIFLIFIFNIFSCISIESHKPKYDVSTFEVLGRLEITYFSLQPLHITSETDITREAYLKLLQTAKYYHTGDIEIVNITVKGEFRPLTLFMMIFFGFTNLFGNYQYINASGDIIIYQEL